MTGVAVIPFDDRSPFAQGILAADHRGRPPWEDLAAEQSPSRPTSSIVDVSNDTHFSPQDKWEGQTKTGRQSLDFLHPTLNAAIQGVLDTYEVRGDKQALEEMLLSNPQYALILARAVPVARRIFGSDIRLTLERVTFHDPREGPVIAATILVSTSQCDALSLLDMFDEQWWRDASIESVSAVVFDVSAR